MGIPGVCHLSRAIKATLEDDGGSAVAQAILLPSSSTPTFGACRAMIDSLLAGNRAFLADEFAAHKAYYQKIAARQSPRFCGSAVPIPA